MKTTRFITSALAALMLTSGATAPVSAAAETAPEAAVGYSISALSKPVIAKASKGRTHIKLTWKKVKGASGYKIYQKTSKGWKCVKTIKSGSKTTYTLDGFNSHTVYYFKLRAYKKSGGKTVYSKYSAAKKVTTKYGAGTTNYTNEYYSFSKINKNWECIVANKGAFNVVQYKRKATDRAESLNPATFSMSTEKLNKERWGKTLDDFVKAEIGEHESEYNPKYYDLTGYRKIDGTKCAVIQLNTEKTTDYDFLSEYILLMLKEHVLYRVDYRYLTEKSDPCSQEIEKMVKSIKLTPKS